MVYERLTICRVKIGINLKENACDGRPEIIIYSETAPTAILAICRQVHQEASPYLEELKAEIMEYKPHVDVHWEYPEFLNSLRDIVHPSGPTIPNNIVRQRVNEYFPFIDSASRRAVVQLIERISNFRTVTVGRPVPFSMRVVHITGNAFKVHSVSRSTHIAFYRLILDLEWNQKRERKLYLGLDAPGVAKHARTPHSITFLREGAMDTMDIDDVLDETTELRDMFELRTGNGSGAD
ncbi:uncharacterized protein N0V89_005348 [Didymosphaeria variabile]|uniref:Uncharacterized protein n=1 Tax=Didymosphaeria variabile TaxID=1932322 RepID=A0A9W9CBN3_9PLEO|nr:uncharacterized protein N0V89_005348 [Didymosphaeria variabile]KAJ4353618.1 hypothetical protein N0V89_005348 [Didymosphaeria variabile]